MEDPYRLDLAYIHDAGFGDLARSAAPDLIDELRRVGLRRGTVVDLGCGSGITSRLFRDAGYEVLGIDLSAPLIEIARQRVPDAEFRIGSFTAIDMPPCVAVTAIGEVFNYGFDPANGTAARAKVFAQIYAALAPGGILMFDTAGPARAPAWGPQRTFVEGPDWTVLVEAEADEAKNRLTRRITTFRKLGDLYRRDFESHELQLVDPQEVAEVLERIGFSVQTLACYGSLTLPPGITGFLARKPGREF
jgi:SAM-dependent methyltransferase